MPRDYNPPKTMEEVDLHQLPNHLHGRIMLVLLRALHNGGTLTWSELGQPYTLSIRKLTKLGLLTKLNPGQYELNYELLKQCSYVVTDSLFLKLADPAYVFEMRKKQGAYQGCRLNYEQMKEKWRGLSASSREVRQQAKKKKVEHDPVADVLFPGKLRDP